MICDNLIFIVLKKIQELLLLITICCVLTLLFKLANEEQELFI